jgi:hypothetical protein
VSKQTFYEDRKSQVRILGVPVRKSAIFFLLIRKSQIHKLFQNTAKFVFSKDFYVQYVLILIRA